MEAADADFMSSLSLVFLVALVVQAVGFAVLASILWCAPEGYQDESGFHLGRKPAGSEAEF